MVVVMKPGTRQQDIDALVSKLKELDLDVGITNGVGCTILGLVGDTTAVDMDKISINPHVERVMRVQEPYKKANRKFHPEDTVVTVGNARIGGGSFSVIAGPCSVESEAQICAVAEDVKASGAALLRGGAFKPRTSPYSFQGMGTAGLDLLMEARKQTGLPIVTEIMDPRMAELFEREVDVVQVGARNMQNFELLKEVGKMSKPILLKRGLSNTYEEWIMSAEYIMSAGNENVILCERGVRTFETYTRNTLDVYGTLSPLLIFQIVFMVGLVVPFSICESIPLLTPVIPASSSNVSFFSCLIFFKLLPIIVLISKIVAPSVSFYYLKV